MSKAVDGPITAQTEHPNLNRRRAMMLAAGAAATSVAGTIPASASSLMADEVETPIAKLYRERESLLTQSAPLYDVYEEAEETWFALRRSLGEDSAEAVSANDMMDEAHDAWSELDSEVTELDRRILTEPIAAESDIAIKASVIRSLEEHRGFNAFDNFRSEMRTFLDQLIRYRSATA